MATKRMLIDASHPEETRVVVLSGNQVEDFDVEVAGDGVFGGPDECGDSASQERLRTAATTDRNLPDTLQAGVALGVKIEVALRVGSRIGHGESPMGMKRRHTGPDCAGGA